MDFTKCFSLFCVLCVCFPFNVLPFHQLYLCIQKCTPPILLYVSKSWGQKNISSTVLESKTKKNVKIHLQDNSSATKIFQGTRTLTGINMVENVAQVNIETLNCCSDFMFTCRKINFKENPEKSYYTHKVDRTEEKRD